MFIRGEFGERGLTDPTDWCYPSGIVVVLETFLLPPRTVGELADSASPDELLSRARRSPVYAALHVSGADDPMQIAATLESALCDFLRSFARQCHDARITDTFLVEHDLRDLANYLKSKYCGVERRPVALSRVPEDGIEEFLAETPRLNRITAAVAEAGEMGEGPKHAATVDLVIDGALIGMMPELTAPLGSALVDRWASERQRFAAIEAVVRAKLAGIETAHIKDYVLGHMPPESAPTALAEAETADLRKALAALLPAEMADAFDPSEGASSLPTLAARLDSELDRVLEPARTVAFGPERVFRYLWQLVRENRNLRAALGGYAGKIRPELVAQSMRGAA